ncbi:sigma-54 dependent transcriptional regulator [Rhodoplanes sp. TEM]|uniref:Sigma-54 dependent transcriptional regulator n=1 Tax=Rhodoplanes tepidamans TaxID=200616 RepID=A0ABT5JC30_RHOTP|nr:MULTISPECIES: sigma-54 dependent transcriptional regulator [Rhodoplanes]MDC7787239.1 sigma-54 dependent transcriptional regulator [Rhodoplanes tepidamans]MDC7986584.1 sigma-54 dependent transcriptional regulator [Rhodoplanes sp. TEM]MDQ0357774.1 two-component system C4-dicarboxylate transport response regulator DctD [Rhodoplanes tepidamans]
MNRAELKVLVVDDDPDMLLGCEQALQLDGCATLGATSVDKALKLLRGGLPGVIVSDIRLPDRDGLSLLAEVQAIDPDLPVVLITGHGDVALAVQVMKSGAYDFVEKPFAPEYLVDVVRRGLEKRVLTLEVRALRHQLRNQSRLEERIIGHSAAIDRLRRLIAEVADTQAPVMIHGETGTGKELVAHCLHEASGRRGRFVAVNCGGLPESLVESELFGHEAGAFTGASKRRIGRIEYANGGTLFLDEIDSMPLSVQVRLLRVLQERSLERLGSNVAIPVDCRIVAATKEDLVQMAEAGRFRADLYYRLDVVTLTLPPLRERREDVRLLFEHFLQASCVTHGRPPPAIHPAKLQQLTAHPWPGNVRELRNVADRFALGIETAFPPFATAGAAPPSLPEAVDAFERAMIADALRRHGMNLSQTAVALRIPKTTLHDKMRKHGLGGE